MVSEKWDLEATRRFFTRALTTTTVAPVEVITDKAAPYPRVLKELAPGAWHHIEPYANNRIEADHGRLKSRLRPMRGLKQLRCARVITTGHAFIQNIRRGHYELGDAGAVGAPAPTPLDQCGRLFTVGALAGSGGSDERPHATTTTTRKCNQTPKTPITQKSDDQRLPW